MKVVVIGLGYVGHGAYELFSKKHDVEVITNTCPDDVKAGDYNDKYDLAVVCVPTQMKDNGQCDTSIVEDVVRKVKAEVILIKSTIEVGTTERLKKETGKRIVFSPEYMGEGNYDSTYDFHTSMIKTPWIILGGDDADCDFVHDIMIGTVGPEKKWFYLSSTEAELVKYTENTYFGMKVTFANEMYNIAKALGCNFERVRQAWGADTRVDIMHTAVFPHARGFSGKCLPKDLNALVYRSKQAGYNPKFLQQMLRSNAEYRGEPELKKVSDD